MAPDFVEQELCSPGIPDQFFHRGNLPLTKREVRLLVLSALQLSPGQVVWDIGAGTGSVSVEVARLCPTTSVWAVEKSPEGAGLIQKNADLLAPGRVTVVKGRAPEVLESLPPPHRVFIGGSAGALEGILEAATAVLAPRGVLVVTALTLETLCCWHGFFASRPYWKTEAWSLQASRLEELGGQLAWKAQNPVQIMAAERR